MSFVLKLQCLSQGLLGLIVVNVRNRHRSFHHGLFPNRGLSIYADQNSIRTLFSFVEGAVSELKFYFLFVLCMFPRMNMFHHQAIVRV